MTAPETRHSIVPLMRAVLPLLCLALGSCATDPLSESLWPPEDFWLEMRAVRLDTGGVHELQKVQIDRNGVVVYRESRGDLENAAFPIPLYTKISVYELDRRSLRQLTRYLDRAGLFERDSGPEQVLEVEDQDQLWLEWRARDAFAAISTSSADQTVLQETVHIVNAYLPEPSRVFYPGELLGDPEPRHVDRAPDPLDDLPGAIDAHRALIKARGGEDVDLLLELFALAKEAGDDKTATDCLRTLEAIAADRTGPDGRADDLILDVIAPLWPLVGGRPQG